MDQSGLSAFIDKKVEELKPQSGKDLVNSVKSVINDIVDKSKGLDPEFVKNELKRFVNSVLSTSGGKRKTRKSRKTRGRR